METQARTAPKMDPSEEPPTTPHVLSQIQSVVDENTLLRPLQILMDELRIKNTRNVRVAEQKDTEIQSLKNTISRHIQNKRESDQKIFHLEAKQKEFCEGVKAEYSSKAHRLLIDLDATKKRLGRCEGELSATQKDNLEITKLLESRRKEVKSQSRVLSEEHLILSEWKIERKKLQEEGSCGRPWQPL